MDIGKQVVATVAIGKAEEVMTALRAGGLHPATAADTAVTVPWNDSAAGKVSIVVMAGELSAAQAIVDAVEAPHSAAADAAARRLGPRLLLVAVVLVVGTWLVLAAIDGAT